jgi:hypothetical protein
MLTTPEPLIYPTGEAEATSAHEAKTCTMAKRVLEREPGGEPSTQGTESPDEVDSQHEEEVVAMEYSAESVGTKIIPSLVA